MDNLNSLAACNANFIKFSTQRIQVRSIIKGLFTVLREFNTRFLQKSQGGLKSVNGQDALFLESH
jgi:hypothetical protein